MRNRNGTSAISYFLSLCLFGAVFAFGGWHFGMKESLGRENDQQAIQQMNLRIPGTDGEQSAKGKAGEVFWYRITLPDGLECVYMRRATSQNGGPTCNWDKWNAKKEAGKEG